MVMLRLGYDSDDVMSIRRFEALLMRGTLDSTLSLFSPEDARIICLTLWRRELHALRIIAHDALYGSVYTMLYVAGRCPVLAALQLHIMRAVIVQQCMVHHPLPCANWGAALADAIIMEDQLMRALQDESFRSRDDVGYYRVRALAASTLAIVVDDLHQCNMARTQAQKSLAIASLCRTLALAALCHITYISPIPLLMR